MQEAWKPPPPLPRSLLGGDTSRVGGSPSSSGPTRMDRPAAAGGCLPPRPSSPCARCACVGLRGLWIMSWGWGRGRTAAAGRKPGGGRQNGEARATPCFALLPCLPAFLRPAESLRPMASHSMPRRWGFTVGLLEGMTRHRPRAVAHNHVGAPRVSRRAHTRKKPPEASPLPAVADRGFHTRFAPRRGLSSSFEPPAPKALELWPVRFIQITGARTADDACIPLPFFSRPG